MAKRLPWENLGQSYGRIGEFDNAICHLEKAIEICREIGERHYEGNALDGLAEIYIDLKKFGNGIRCAEEALAIRRQIGDRYGEALSLEQMGQALCRSGKPCQARDLWKKALALYERLGHPKTATVQGLLDQIA